MGELTTYCLQGESWLAIVFLTRVGTHPPYPQCEKWFSECCSCPQYILIGRLCSDACIVPLGGSKCLLLPGELVLVAVTYVLFPPRRIGMC